MEFLTAKIENKTLTEWNNILHLERAELLAQLQGQERANLVIIQENLDLKKRVKWLEEQWKIAADSRYNFLVHNEELAKENEKLKLELSSDTNDMIRNKLRAMLTLQQDLINLVGRV